jgi:hypothetical protein
MTNIEMNAGHTAIRMIVIILIRCKNCLLSSLYKIRIQKFNIEIF